MSMRFTPVRFSIRTPDFAQAVTDAGINWIGPSPQALSDGDKMTARLTINSWSSSNSW